VPVNPVKEGETFQDLIRVCLDFLPPQTDAWRHFRIQHGPPGLPGGKVDTTSRQGYRRTGQIGRQMLRCSGQIGGPFWSYWVQRCGHWHKEVKNGNLRQEAEKKLQRCECECCTRLHKHSLDKLPRSSRLLAQSRRASSALSTSCWIWDEPESAWATWAWWLGSVDITAEKQKNTVHIISLTIHTPPLHRRLRKRLL
jgi:hypothetical protein